MKGSAPQMAVDRGLLLLGVGLQLDGAPDGAGGEETGIRRPTWPARGEVGGMALWRDRRFSLCRLGCCSRPPADTAGVFMWA